MIDLYPFSENWFRALVGLIIGLVLGSFVTMLSYRLPRRLSIVTPSSRCPRCQAALKPRDLVPVFSWLSTGGKCRYCGVKISARYVLIELATGLGGMAAFMMMGFQPGVLVALIAVVTIVALMTMRIERKN